MGNRITAPETGDEWALFTAVLVVGLVVLLVALSRDLVYSLSAGLLFGVLIALGLAALVSGWRSIVS